VIPSAYIQEWAATTPWPDPRQVEQDLIICRALCDIFKDPYLAERVAFRGGTTSFPPRPSWPEHLTGTSHW
jgi:hypothetical protein